MRASVLRSHLRHDARKSEEGMRRDAVLAADRSVELPRAWTATRSPVFGASLELLSISALFGLRDLFLPK